MILIYFILLQIYNPSKVDPFVIFKNMKNPPESLFMIFPREESRAEIKGGSLSGFDFGIYRKSYFFNSNSFLIFPSERRYFESINNFTFYPFFPDTLFTLKEIFWNYDKEGIEFLTPFKLKFLRSKKYYRIFLRDTGELFLRKTKNCFQNLIQAEGGLGFIGTGFLHEFIYGKYRDFFVSPYVFGMFELDNRLFFYPGVYFDVLKNQFYPEFSLSLSPNRLNILTILYEKRTFFSFIPEIYDSFLPFFNFKDSIYGLKSFKDELNFIYEGRWIEKVYMRMNFCFGVYDSLRFFIKDSIWEPVIFDRIKAGRFDGVLKYEFSRFKFRVNFFYLYSEEMESYWRNKINLNIGYEFNKIKPFVEFIYPFRFEEPIWIFRVTFFPSKNIYLKFFFRWIKRSIKYYNNYTLNSEAGIGIGVKKD